MHILLQFVRRTSVLNYELPLAHVLILFEVMFLTVARDSARFSKYIQLEVFELYI